MRLYLLFILLISSYNALYSQKLLGGDDICFDEGLYDPSYPMMKEWAKAGVEGGIPSHDKTEVKYIVSPSDDFVSILCKVSDKGGGVILLKKGDYLLKQTLNIPSNVIIRGENREETRILVDMHGYHFSTGKPTSSALCMDKVERSGIENMTIKYVTPDFEPRDKQHVYDSWEKEIFHVQEKRDTTLFVDMVLIVNSRNCWVDNCQILWSGNDAIRIVNSEHITCRGNYIDRSYNKCDGGMGYYNIIGSKYILSCYEKVRRIRHYAIHLGSKYCVAINNDFEIDVNFHDGDEGYNLIENNRIIIPVWHSWHCFQRGASNLHKPAGKWNILYNNITYHKLNGSEYSERNKVYLMNTEFGGKTVLETNLQSPKGNTFYPVKLKN